MVTTRHSGRISGRTRSTLVLLRAAGSVQSVPVTYDTIYGVSWSPDGTKLAFGCADNTLRAIDVASGEQVLQHSQQNLPP
jgi:WD40 repeat protein